ncbi:glycoside hydrolase family 31 protein [Pseudopedobacter beijingensis]|uniref:TIM-barrel domain-containing protein n=1 Tax=Pseudopedobacter beijingensis TaxID=1207056 RepID=A0ABW4IG74_9SPHI
MTKFYLHILFCFSLILCRAELFANTSKIYSGSKQIVSDNGSVVMPEKQVRFTVLTPRLIRMEWDNTGKFVDNASFTVVNRNLPQVKYTVSKSAGWFRIKTAEVELSYKSGSGKFNVNNLSIRYFAKGQKPISWKPGDVQQNNLKGTSRTLDKYDGDIHTVTGEKLTLEDGILSRDGWFFLDDSQSLLFDNSEWAWAQKRQNDGAQDWYFMAYGNNYKQALADYTKIGGKVPLPPRYAFGYWWSRYWSYSDAELKKLVSNFEKFNIPLDVLVIDMDWHLADKGGVSAEPDEFGEPKMWTGWTWNKNLFPDPPKFLEWATSKKLKTTLNLHPASGIGPHEIQYSEFVKKMDFDTTQKKFIPFLGSSKKFMNNLFDVVLNPMQKEGVSFWWLDWQQWLEDKEFKGLSNTWWLNYTFFSDMERCGDKRPMIFHRWGGLGNHRYQIGFSGDTRISWASLAYQPYFTNSASNVLYGYWSHDIGGHIFPKNSNRILDQELYTRWIQYGALSPIFRTHSTKSSFLNKEMWNFRGEYFDAQYKAIHLRYQLVPYIYTMARKTYDTGISLCRPMYYDYPNDEEAYTFENQYQFGDDMLIAPISTPMKDDYTKAKVWLPKGTDWYEWHTGTLLKGGQVVERAFSLDEYPIYIKAGAVIPMYRDVTNLQDNSGKITLGVFPGGNYQTRLYEDNGDDKKYETEYAYTSISTSKKQNSMNITISPREGSYKGMLKNKTYEVVLYGSVAPKSVLVNGKNLDRQVFNTENQGWKYRGDDLSLVISLPETLCTDKTEISILYNEGDTQLEKLINDGMSEKFKRLERFTSELKVKKNNVILPNSIGKSLGTKNMLEYYPERFGTLVREFDENYRLIPQDAKGMELRENVLNWYLGRLGL